jgi:hypothetical protein
MMIKTTSVLLMAIIRIQNVVLMVVRVVLNVERTEN